MSRLSLAGRTIFITGASRGIGKAIGIRAAKDGANVVIAAKTSDPHPKLPGTIHTVAKEVEAAGGKALAVVLDVRSEESIAKAVAAAANHFGGIDVLVNNASAIQLTNTLNTPAKRFDLMHQVNVRATFLCSQACIPYLKKGKNPHILNLSPPLNLNPVWFKDHVAYTMSKYGMSMCALGMAAELRDAGIAVNALWPRTAIWTAAMEMLAAGGVGAGGQKSDAVRLKCRKPEILADAAHAILTQPAAQCTGNFFIDDDVLSKLAGVSAPQIEQLYAYAPGAQYLPDFFLGDTTASGLLEKASSSGADGASAAGAKTGGAGGGKLEALWERVRGAVSDDMVPGTNALFLFELSGPEAGKWCLDLKTSASGVQRVLRQLPQGYKAADAVFRLDSNDFIKLFSGQASGAALFMSGKMKVSGDISLAMKLQKLFGQLQKKK